MSKFAVLHLMFVSNDDSIAFSSRFSDHGKETDSLISRNIQAPLLLLA